MRIAYFTDTYLPQINGVTYTIQAWKEELEKRGHEVHVVYPDTGRGTEPGEVPVPSVPVKIVEGYRASVSIPGDLSHRIPETDVVHVHSPFTSGFLGKKVAKRDSSPVLATHHTAFHHYFDYVSHRKEVKGLMEKMYRWWERRFYQGVDGVMAPSCYTAKHLEQRTGIEVKTTSNGVDTDFFRPKDEGFLEDQGVEKDRVIGFCGRLGYEKNLEDLVKFSDRFDGEVVMAGGGFAKEHYLELFEQKENITYLGRLDREMMPEFYSALDLFVIPSTAETQGVSVLEANACGTPAVGADALALKETVEEGINGYRYIPGDIDSLERSVREAYSGLESLQERALEKAEEHSVEAVVDSLLEVYRRRTPAGEDVDR